MPIPRPRRARAACTVRRQQVLSKAVEPLEQRRLLAVTIDADGWTRVTPSSDTRTIYVSSSEGNDTNSGTSPNAPVKTLARATTLVRSGSPDHLLLKRGDVFHDTFPMWSKSGKNAQEPLLISSYGSDNAARPWVKTGAKRAFYTNAALHDVAIIGIKFEAHTRNPDSADYVSTAGDYGLQIVGPVNGFLVEDSSFDHYVYNVSVQGFSDYATNVKFRRSQFTDSYKAGDKAVGFYASMTRGMLLEENLFDHNGWNEQLASGGNSHNVYFWESSRDPIIRGNIIANGGQHGLQARGGGTIENNLFIRNPIHLMVGNGSTVAPGGVVAKVSGNVFLDSKDMAGAGRGWAIEIGNIKAGGGSYVRDNIIAHDSQDNFAAIKLERPFGVSPENEAQGVGINDLSIERNIVYQWHQAISISDYYDVGGTGHRRIDNLLVRDNEFQDIVIQKIVNHNPAYDGSEEQWSGNSYYSSASSSGWFSINGTTTSFATWKNTVEPTASNQRITYPDPGRNVGRYNATLGGAATRDAFLAKVRGQNSTNWKDQYTASEAIEWIRAGFTGATVTPPSEPETPTDPEPTPPPAPTPINTPPAAQLNVSDRTSATQSAHTFTVTYTDDNAVKVSSFGNGDIRVTGPDGFDAAATFVSADSTTNGTPRTATYAIAAPGGSWNTADNGTYTVNLNGSGVRDAQGFYAPAQTLGTFKVNIAAPTPAPVPSNPDDGPDSTPPTVLWSNFDPTEQTITLRFSEDVSDSLSTSDMRLKNTKTGALVSYNTMRMNYDAATNTATWSFTDPLPIADYKVMLGGGLVLDDAGNKLDGDNDGEAGDDHILKISAAEMTEANALATMSSQSDPFAPVS